jgi:hypothetical protein
MSDYGTVVDSLDICAAAGSSHVRKRMPGHDHPSVYAAKEVDTNLEALLLEVGVDSLQNIDDWPRSDGFEVRPRPHPDDPRNRARLDLQLLAPLYRDVFRTLAADLCDRLLTVSTEEHAVRTLHEQLEHWQAFLKKHRPEGLGDEMQAGLYGELLILKDLFLAEIAASRAVRSWRGCKKAHQDFQLPGMALEVKTTRAAIIDRIRVSNVQQLDSDAPSPLFLTVVHVHANEASGDTLPDLIATIRSALTTSDHHTFDAGLLEVGYLDLHADRYRATRYQTMEIRHFKVDAGFPRLVSADLPPGVKAVQYTIGTDACAPFKVDYAAVRAELRAQGGGT